MASEMTQHEKGRRKAEVDWENECASFLFHGDFTSDRPVIHSCGLYLGVSWEEEIFVRSHNATIIRLIDLHGLPFWAPGSRIVAKREVPALLVEAEPIHRYIPATKKERTVVRRGIRVWTDKLGTGPTLFKRLDERRLVVIAGRVNEVVRVDFIDTLSNRWMCTYEFDPSECPCAPQKSHPRCRRE